MNAIETAAYYAIEDLQAQVTQLTQQAEAYREIAEAQTNQLQAILHSLPTKIRMEVEATFFHSFEVAL